MNQTLNTFRMLYFQDYVGTESINSVCFSGNLVIGLNFKYGKKRSNFFKNRIYCEKKFQKRSSHLQK